MNTNNCLGLYFLILFFFHFLTLSIFLFLLFHSILFWSISIPFLLQLFFGGRGLAGCRASLTRMQRHAVGVSVFFTADQVFLRCSSVFPGWPGHFTPMYFSPVSSWRLTIRVDLGLSALSNSFWRFSFLQAGLSVFHPAIIWPLLRRPIGPVWPHYHSVEPSLAIRVFPWIRSILRVGYFTEPGQVFWCFFVLKI